MELLREIYGKDLGLIQEDSKEICYKFRKAVRALVYDKEGRIAILFVSKKNYHKLPGGGIEDGEDIDSALAREILEETGCGIEEKMQEVGAVIEYRDMDKLMQISYCYLVNVTGKPRETTFTEKEKENGFQLKWFNLNEAIDVLRKDMPVDSFEKFMRARDLIFLEKAKEIIQ